MGTQPVDYADLCVDLRELGRVYKNDEKGALKLVRYVLNPVGVLEHTLGEEKETEDLDEVIEFLRAVDTMTQISSGKTIRFISIDIYPYDDDD